MTNDEKIDLLIEGVIYYHADPSRRATNENGVCLYKTADGRRCLVGRLITEADTNFPVLNGCGTIVVSEFEKNMPESIKSLLGEGFVHRPFLLSCQRLHDDNGSKFWASQGITKTGVHEAAAILSLHCGVENPLDLLREYGIVPVEEYEGVG